MACVPVANMTLSAIAVRSTGVGVDDSVLRAVHNADSVEALWHALKRGLDQAMPHHSLSLYFNYLAPDRGFRVLHDQHSPGSVVPWFLRRQLSPAPEFLRQHPGVKTYRLRQLLPDVRVLRRSDYFRQVMRVEGWDSLLGLGFWEGERLVALLVLRRTEIQGEFEPEEVALLEKWHPHFLDALRRIQRLESDSVLRACLSSCLQMLSLGVLIFDWNLTLRIKNDAAARLFIEWAHGPGKGGQLHLKRAFAVPPAVGDALRSARERTLEGCTGSVISRAHDSTIEVRAFSPDGLFLADPFFIVQLRPDRPDLADKRDSGSISIELLTPCERTVAALAAEGLSNGEIALRLRKSERTVASQMSAVLAKLHISGRVHLARLVG